MLSIGIKYIEPIKKIYESSFLSRDGGILNNIRFKWAREAVIGLPKYPFGGNNEIGHYTTHVVWTEFAKDGGIIPFILILIWNVCVIKDVIVLSFSRKIELQTKIFLILPYVGIFLYSCTENLIYYMFEMSVLTIIAGMIRGQVLNNQIKMEE